MADILQTTLAFEWNFLKEKFCIYISRMFVSKFNWQEIHFGSGDVLVPSGNKPLVELMLTEDSGHHMMSSKQNELS